MYPTISISSPILTLPYSIVPVTTVPLPGIVKVESTDIINGLSVSLLIYIYFYLSGTGISVSIYSSNYKTDFSPSYGSVSILACKADPFTI